MFVGEQLSVPIGVQREKQIFFSHPTIVDSINNMQFSFVELTTEDLCFWLQLVNLGEYVTLFENYRQTINC